MRAEHIFLKALEKDSSVERSAYLDGACGDDAALRAEVNALLVSDEQAGSFLEQPVFQDSDNTIDSPPISERTGAMIGPYKLLEKIGEGGFGIVFMAEQQKSIVRKVALKVIKPGMDTKEVIARFEAERQALALMDHPHIARVLDAGATESGRPYFVMELVRGIPITDYCDQNSLGFRERLELFTCVCQAVQHAHQKGIIHRDVKPSNILVTLHDGVPVPKIIDFGVAKAIDRRLTERTLFTRFSEMIGTPLYMSPEQAEMSGLDVDTRTDIYSLGVLLYELLTGSTPVDRDRLGKATYDEIRRIIREEEPLKPSMRVSTMDMRATTISEHRKTEPKKLYALLKGDLDWIVMKALEKDRTRRYATAKDFADDVQHYLTDQPVEARAPSSLYRLGKLVRRYRAASATIAAIVVTLIAATVFSTWMAVQADRARNRVQVAMKEVEHERQLAREEAEKARKAAAEAEMSFEVIVEAMSDDTDRSLVNPDETFAEVLERLITRLDVNTELNPYVKTRIRLLIARIYLRTGNKEVVETHLCRAAEAISAGNEPDALPVSRELLRRLADTWDNLATSAKDARINDVAEFSYRNALVFWEKLSEINRGETWHRGQVAATVMAIGDLLEQNGKLNDAKQAFGRALAIHSLLVVERSDDPVYRERLKTNCSGLARVMKSRGSVEETQRAIDNVFADAGHAPDDKLSFEVWLAFGKGFRDERRWLDAQTAFLRAMDLCEHTGPVGLQQRHDATMNLSDIFLCMREWQAAEKIHQDFLGLVEGEWEKKDPRRADHEAFLEFARCAQGNAQDTDLHHNRTISRDCQTKLAELWITLATRAQYSGNNQQAELAFRKSLAHRTTLAEGNPENAWNRQELAFFHDRLGEFLARLCQYDEAEQACTQGVELHEQLVEDYPEDTNYRNRLVASYRSLGHVFRSRGKINEATKAYAKSTNILKNALAKAEQSGDSSSQSELWRLIGREMRQQSRLFEALDAYNRAMLVADTLSEQRWQHQADTLVNMSLVLMDLQDWRGAESNYHRFLELAADQTTNTDNHGVFMQYLFTLVLEQQGRDQEAKSLRTKLLSVFETAQEVEKNIWYKSMDQITYAELLSELKQDDVSLQEAARMLATAEGGIEAWFDIRGWWHGVSADVHDKMGHTQEALRHARISLEQTPSGNLGFQKAARDRLVRLLVIAGQLQDAEDVLHNVLQEKVSSLGANHIITHYARTDLAEFLVERKQYTKADDLLREVQTGVLSQTCVPASQKYRVIRLSGDVCQSLGKPEQAAQWRTRLDMPPESKSNETEMENSIIQ